MLQRLHIPGGGVVDHDQGDAVGAAETLVELAAVEDVLQLDLVVRRALAGFHRHGLDRSPERAVELDPGSDTDGPNANGDEYHNGDTIPVSNTAPDTNVDQILSALDGDTRSYLRLLLVEGGTGLNGRGKDLGKLLGSLGPINRGLALGGALFRIVFAMLWVIAPLNSLAGLRLLSDVPYLKIFEPDRLQALARVQIAGSFDDYYVGLPFLGLAATSAP